MLEVVPMSAIRDNFNPSGTKQEGSDVLELELSLVLCKILVSCQLDSGLFLLLYSPYRNSLEALPACILPVTLAKGRQE